ncbi:MAG: penicillin-binding protein 2 [Paracoccaceae bacterium]
MKRPVKETEESARLITRRGLFIGAVQVGVMGVLAARMRYLGVDQADRFRLLAEDNRIRYDLLPPVRGLIFDRNGVPIAQNEQTYRIVIKRADVDDLDATFMRLRALIGLTDAEIEKARAEVLRANPGVAVTVADRLSWDDLAEVAVNGPALPGVSPEVGLSRRYPRDQDFAHLVGYVGPVSDYYLSQIEKPDPLLLTPRFQIGRVGVEAKMEGVLRGAAGNKRVEVNARGRVMRELDRREGASGADLQLTIDAGLQNFVQARLAGESAAAVVMDVQTGDLLAMGSAPSYDPNKFVRGISQLDYSSLTENIYRPLANKTVQGLYPPGSTFKMVTALAAVEGGVITAGETVYCPGYTEVGGRRFHCWKRGGHGWIDMHDSLKQSCDVYYYELAQRAGIERISAMARKLGLGTRFDIPLSAVAEGLAPDKDWKFRRYKQDWVVGDSLNASIGQGFVLASPLQLAVMTARLATGTGVSPRLVKSIEGIEQPVVNSGPLGLGPTTLGQVRKAMYAVSNHRGGTGYSSRILAEGKQMAGKTGTSQVRSVVVRNEDVPWEQRDHALFVGYAPFDNPKYAVSVVVEHGGGGSAAAAPVARDILLQAEYGGLPPLDAYPESQHRQIEQRQQELLLYDGENVVRPIPRSDRA